VQVTSVVTLSTHAKEDVSQSAEPDVLTEVRESVATGEPEFEESEERQASSDEFSGSADIDGDEQTDGFTEDAEAEVDVTGDESTQSTEPENNLAVIANEDGQSAASHGDAVEYDAQDAELATPAILLRGEYSEPTNTSHHHTDEDEENAESWELDDGYAVWDETFDGDEFDVAPAGEPDSVSSGSSTLSGKTASITSKRSFDEVDESEPTMEQSLSQNPKKNTNAMTRVQHVFQPHIDFGFQAFPHHQHHSSLWHIITSVALPIDLRPSTHSQLQAFSLCYC